LVISKGKKAGKEVKRERMKGKGEGAFTYGGLASGPEGGAVLRTSRREGIFQRRALRQAQGKKTEYLITKTPQLNMPAGDGIQRGKRRNFLESVNRNSLRLGGGCRGHLKG
jgi:hypothetical protein